MASGFFVLNDTEKLEQQVQDIEDDMEQMQSEVQMYSPIMPSFRPDHAG